MNQAMADPPSYDDVLEEDDVLESSSTASPTKLVGLLKEPGSSALFGKNKTVTLDGVLQADSADGSDLVIGKAVAWDGESFAYSESVDTRAFESRTVMVMVRMLDHGCAWIEGGCSSQPSLLKSSHQFRSDHGELRTGEVIRLSSVGEEEEEAFEDHDEDDEVSIRIANTIGSAVDEVNSAASEAESHGTPSVQGSIEIVENSEVFEEYIEIAENLEVFEEYIELTNQESLRERNAYDQDSEGNLATPEIQPTNSSILNQVVDTLSENGSFEDGGRGDGEEETKGASHGQGEGGEEAEVASQKESVRLGSQKNSFCLGSDEVFEPRGDNNVDQAIGVKHSVCLGSEAVSEPRGDTNVEHKAITLKHSVCLDAVSGRGDDNVDNKAIPSQVVVPKKRRQTQTSLGLKDLKNLLAPLEKTPLEKTPLEKTPLEKTPLEKKPLEKKPLEKKPLEKKPLERTTLEKMPRETTPSLSRPETKDPPEIITTLPPQVEEATVVASRVAMDPPEDCNALESQDSSNPTIGGSLESDGRSSVPIEFISVKTKTQHDDFDTLELLESFSETQRREALEFAKKLRLRAKQLKKERQKMKKMMA